MEVNEYDWLSRQLRDAVNQYEWLVRRLARLLEQSIVLLDETVRNTPGGDVFLSREEIFTEHFDIHTAHSQLALEQIEVPLRWLMVNTEARPLPMEMKELWELIKRNEARINGRAILQPLLDFDEYSSKTKAAVAVLDRVKVKGRPAPQPPTRDTRTSGPGFYSTQMILPGASSETAKEANADPSNKESKADAEDEEWNADPNNQAW